MEERWFTDEVMRTHEAPAGYPETPARLEAVLAAGESRRAAGSASLDLGDTEAVTVSDLESAVCRIHDPAYVERFRMASARGDGVLDSADNPMSESTWDAACAAVRASMRAADFVADGTGRHGFAAVRPPGHHAERAIAMGFCFFANIAIAAQHLLDRHGMERIAIVDFDVHHGNGTQHLFESRADVLFISLHQHPFYPGTGAATERGVDAGVGATLNIPLDVGCDDAVYAEAFGTMVVPALEAFEPQALLVSAGFDAWRADPLGGMQVSREGFRHFGTRLADAADRLCEGRLLSALEGGYDVSALGDLVSAYLDGVADCTSY